MGAEDFEAVVKHYYASLYRFALSLTHQEGDACDLTQQTFYIWATKGHQLRDPSKVKTWLFTTLHREFLHMRRHQDRISLQEPSESEADWPTFDPELADRLDGQTLVALLSQVDLVFQAPVALFYLEDLSYKEIAETLQVPLGTVKSRIARGLAQLHRLIASRKSTPPSERNSPA